MCPIETVIFLNLNFSILRVDNRTFRWHFDASSLNLYDGNLSIFKLLSPGRRMDGVSVIYYIKCDTKQKRFSVKLR